jgi:predicted DCC family thiol-disulfide oxidoreductase YuxK
MAKVKVYYNSACPVCDAGIKDQRRRMEACSAQVEWVDIELAPDAVKEIGVSLELVRERLHVVDETGVTRVGAEAFAVLWEQTPEQRKLARFIRFPIIRLMVRLFYNVFAAALYGWNRAKDRWHIEK